VASGVHSIVPVVRLLSRRLLDRASSSSELSGTRGLKRRAYSFLWLSVVRFLWGARLGAILSKVRVCSTGWLLVCATFCSTRCASWVVGLRSVRARRLSAHFSFGYLVCRYVVWYSCGGDFHLGGFLSDNSGTTTWLRLHRSSQVRGILSRLVGTYAVQVFAGISSLSEVFGACGRCDRGAVRCRSCGFTLSARDWALIQASESSIWACCQVRVCYWQSLLLHSLFRLVVPQGGWEHWQT
jgi:hypothetical protein